MKFRSSAWLAVLIGVAAGACSIDRTPELTGTSERSGDLYVPDRAIKVKTSTEQFGPMATPTGPMTVEQNGGLQCGGVFCPFAAAPMRPCCTAASDVTQGSARAADRCGLDFNNVGSDFFQGPCWQRDQLGVVDDRCPNLATDPGTTELGCCSDQGQCGSMNTVQALGCHYEAGITPKRCGMADIEQGKQCEPLGVFGVRSTVDLAWGGRSGGLVGLTDDGRGPLVIHLLVSVESIDADTNELHGTIKPCGVDLPAFYSTTLCESYKPVFPERIWESKKLPLLDLMGRYQCLHPGCVMTLDAQTELLGIDLENPEAPWPMPTETGTLACAAGKGVACFNDHDDDKLPGMTIELLTMGMAPPGTGCDGTYVYKGAPLSSSPAAILGSVRRANRVLLGTRTKLGGSGKIADDCNSGVGSGIAQFVESRAWGCFVQPGTNNFGEAPAGPNDACDAGEAMFLDDNLPIYHILNVGETPDPMLNLVDKSASTGPGFSLVRLGGAGDSVTCADVRAAHY